MCDVMALSIKPGDRMPDDRIGAGEIVRNFAGPEKRRRCARGASDGSYLVIIGGSPADRRTGEYSSAESAYCHHVRE
jgi:hypothetical protein